MFDWDQLDAAAGGQTSAAGGQTTEAGGQTPEAGGDTPGAGGDTLAARFEREHGFLPRPPGMPPMMPEVEKQYQQHPCLPLFWKLCFLQIDVLKFECEFQSMSLCFQSVVSKSIRSYW
jgi:hypothetical protein